MSDTTNKRRRLEKGDAVRVRGLRGDFTYQYERNGEITVFGGPAGYGGFHTVTPDRIVKKRRQEVRA